MKSTTLFLVLAVCFSSMAVSQAFFFNDNMLMWMMMMNPQFGGSMGGGMPLFMLASGSDKMNLMGQSMLLSRMMRGQGHQQASQAGSAGTPATL